MKTRIDQTISQCGKIIRALDIPLKVKRKDCYKGMIFSIVICDKDYPYAFSSGCGNSYKEALACALGEFIERMQHGLLYNEFYFCSNLTSFETTIPINRKKIKKQFLPYKSDKKIDCYVYKNFYTETNEYIPVEYIKQNCGSSGMSAGIDMNDSFKGSLKEIVERFICKMLYKKQPFELTSGYYDYSKFVDTHNKKLIDYLQDDGFKIQVIDLSLKQKFPFVGVFLFADIFRFSFGLGTGESINKAINDALIQILRGKNDRTSIIKNMRSFIELDYQMNTYNAESVYSHEYFLQRSYSHGAIPIEILKYALQKEVNIDDGMFKKMKKNLQQTCKNMGWEIFVRHPKFIGFSTCHVFIPNISEINFTEDRNLINYKLLRCELLKFTDNQSNALNLLNLLLKSFNISNLFSNLFNICYPEFTIKKEMNNTINLADMLNILFAYIVDNENAKQLKNINPNKFSSFNTLIDIFTSKQIKHPNILLMQKKDLQNVIEILKKYPFQKNCKHCIIKDVCLVKKIKYRIDKFIEL